MKHLFRKNNFYWLLLIPATLVISCKEENSVEIGNSVTDTSATASIYLTALRTLGTNEESADYLLTMNSVQGGTISAVGQGLEQLGWCYPGNAGDTYFSFSYTVNECLGYKITNDGKIVQKGKFQFERVDCINAADENTLIGIGAPWGGGSFNTQIQLIDAEQIKITKSALHPLYTLTWLNNSQKKDTLNCWPTHSFINGGKLFVTFYPLHGTSWATPLTDTAYISIFTYPGLEYIKTIKDTRTSPIGYYGSNPAVLKDENGDFYTISTSSYVAGFSQSTKPSGILRVKKNTDVFDASYFFDVENAGGNYRLLTAAYVGNGKAVARVIKVAADTAVWAAFNVQNPICNLVVLDLYNKTVTPITDVPLHGGQYYTPFLVENGKVHVSVNDGSKAYLYLVDPLSATAVKEAEIKGIEVQALWRVR
jgi:hypothetical protein